MNNVTGRTVAEMLAGLSSPTDCLKRAGTRESPGAPLNRRSAAAGVAILSFGCTFVSAEPGDEPVLVDGWVVRPSDIKPFARR